MKKLLLLTAIAVFGFGTMNAQVFKLGAGVAIPTGDFGDFYGFGVNIDGAYLFEVAEGVHVGPKAGLIYTFGKTFTESFGGVDVSIDVDDAAFVPVGATGRVMLGDAFVLGADLGYGIGVSPDGIESGFYYRPMIGYMVSDLIGIMLSYTGISLDGATFNTINGGIEFGL